MISRTAPRLRRPLSLTASSPEPLKTLIARFSSSWSSTATVETTSHDQSTGEESAVFSASRKFARPATVTWSERLHNSVSLIGTVEYPLKQYATNGGKFGVHTLLRVQSSPNSRHTFRILIGMWDMLAERALAHLKQNDYIYVAGQLGSYKKSTIGGIERMYYQVTANEFNYVEVSEHNFQVVSKAGLETSESSKEKYRSRLLRWQQFFGNPDEWYDHRETKQTPRHPDFKHKSTKEAIWLNRDDPPWVKKQLQLLDTRLTEKSSHDPSFCSSPSNWLSDEQLAVPDLMECDFKDETYNRVK